MLKKPHKNRKEKTEEMHRLPYRMLYVHTQGTKSKLLWTLGLS